jgi:NADPH:quinone reductase-like Zn-dependent oxidoreductase
MDLGLDGQVVIVTGASRGIGFGVTQAFVDAGAKVIAGSPRRSAAAASAPTPSALVRSPPTSGWLAVVLASEPVGSVTGADFRIDGGLIPTW